MGGTYSQETLEAKFEALSQRCLAIENQLALVSEKLGLAYTPWSVDVPPEVLELVRSGKRLEAVARYRALTNANFDDARRVVESI